MTTADNMVPVLCTLARHHKGDHSEHGKPATHPCAKVIRYEERVVEEPRDARCPVTHGGYQCQELAHHEKSPGDHGHRGENGYFPPDAPLAPPPIPPAPVPAELPALADLIGNVLGALADVDIRKRETIDAEDKWKRCIDRRIEAEQALDRARSEVAKRAGKGALVMVGTVLYRSVPPRKPKGGEVPADALWRLEPVEVAK